MRADDFRTWTQPDHRGLGLACRLQHGAILLVVRPSLGPVDGRGQAVKIDFTAVEAIDARLLRGFQRLQGHDQRGAAVGQIGDELGLGIVVPLRGCAARPGRPRGPCPDPRRSWRTRPARLRRRRSRAGADRQRRRKAEAERHDHHQANRAVSHQHHCENTCAVHWAPTLPISRGGSRYCESERPNCGIEAPTGRSTRRNRRWPRHDASSAPARPCDIAPGRRSRTR